MSFLTVFLLGVAFCVGCLFGFCVCASLAATRIADLNADNWALLKGEGCQREDCPVRLLPRAGR